VSRDAIADAVVVAAGSSQRMGGHDKLDAPIGGLPLLRWAVRAMGAAPEVADIVIVTSAERGAQLRDADWLTSVRARVVTGGPRRQDSVAAGVLETHAEIVLVHDAARPFASPSLISRVVEATERHGAAIPVLPVVDALKHLEGERISGAAERHGLFRAQTPQGARRDLLAAAVEAHAGGPDAIADEAELLARAGFPVHVVEGEATNIKVTVPADLAMARLLAGGVGPLRLALGSDAHPFGPGEGLRLGGILVEGAPRLHGHSDGDVVLHALCDGLLAASGGGDLGRLFPSGEATTRGIDSRSLVREVMAHLEQSELAVDSVDVTIRGARPRLGGRRLDAIGASIAELTGSEPRRVSVKAATGNLSGDDGAGRTMSATCLVAVVPR
jgi:2-C-methyl-D-erythritol 4-phosphate cytidylyltransferase/2-C-methyl-D-erythritol 2,4-cyclodiphosphate synthase